MCSFLSAAILGNNKFSQNKIMPPHDAQSHLFIQLKIEIKISEKYLHCLSFASFKIFLPNIFCFKINHCIYLLNMVLYYRKTFSYMYVLYLYLDHIPSSMAWHLTMAEVQNMMVILWQASISWGRYLCINRKNRNVRYNTV